MIRRKGPILAAAVIAAFALGWYRGLFGVEPVAPTGTPVAEKPPADASGRASAPTDQAGRRAADIGQATTPPPPASVATADPNAAAVPDGQGGASMPAAPAVPGFDIVRVEPDGSAVVAGRGAANEPIALTDGTRTLGETRTDANGDFVITLSLPKGSHRLQLAQRDDAISDDAAVVNVPPPGRPDQLLVMMQRPGEASEILQRPDEPAIAEAAAEPTVSNAGRSVETGREPQMAAVEPSAAPSTAATEARPADAGLSVEAVEIEGDRLFVAGSAKGRSTVRIYLDDAFVAESRSGDGDRFIATARADVPVGDHMIRADALDATGRVVGRVEVPFQRPEGPSMAAVAAAPAAAPGAPNALTAPASSAAGDGNTAANKPAPAGQARANGAPAPSEPSEHAATVEPPPAGAPVPPTTAADEPRAIQQPALQAAASRVIIRRGDTLWRISRQTYGRGSRYTVIYLANGDQIRDPDRIYPGQVFRMPSTADEPTAPRG